MCTKDSNEIKYSFLEKVLWYLKRYQVVPKSKRTFTQQIGGGSLKSYKDNLRYQRRKKIQGKDEPPR